MLPPCLAPSHWLLLGCPYSLQAAGELWDCFSALLLLDIFSFKSSLSCSLLARGLTGLGNGALSCAALKTKGLFFSLLFWSLSSPWGWEGWGRLQGDSSLWLCHCGHSDPQHPACAVSSPCTMSAGIKSSSSSSSSTDLSWCWAPGTTDGISVWVLSCPGLPSRFKDADGGALACLTVSHPC